MRRTHALLLACWSLLAALLACNLAGGQTASPIAAPSALPATQPDFHVDMRQAEQYLTSDELEGRLVGTPGIEKAGQYIAETFAKLGLQPAPGQADYFQTFKMTSGVKIDSATTFASGEGKPWMGDASPKLRSDYQPISVSAEADFAGPVAFAGYGITDKDHAYDDYADLDVKDKVVLVLRYEPQDAEGKSRITGKEKEWSPHATFNEKARNAASRGAKALLVVDLPRKAGAKGALMPFVWMGMSERASIPVVQVTVDLANRMLKVGADQTIEALREKIEADFKPRSQLLEGVTAKGSVAFKKEQKDVRNVVAVLPGKGQHADEYVVIGAHYDHLGRGGAGSLAPFKKEIHHGADDNASGTTAIMAIADKLAHLPPQPRSLMFVAFTAEEEGLIGSQYFVEHPLVPLEKMPFMLNLDMVGRVRDEKLSIGGTGTAPGFDELVKNSTAGSPLKVFTGDEKEKAQKQAHSTDSGQAHSTDSGQAHGGAEPTTAPSEGVPRSVLATFSAVGKGGMGPSDHMKFAQKKIPVLFLFSGIHADYHRPSDTVDKINFKGMDEVVDLGVKVVEGLAKMPRAEYVATFDRDQQMSGGPRRVRLGVMPDYSDDTIKGVRITGAAPGSPAEKAGLKDGDVLLQMGETKLNNLNDLQTVLEKAKPGQKMKVLLLRNGKETETEVVFTEPRG